jgi:hypothetical protein
MSLKKTRFIKGIILAPDNVPLEEAEGEIKVDSTSGKIQVTLKDGVNPSAAREIVTNSQEQTLTNKIIDAASNTISNITVPMLASGVLDIDLTSVSTSDDTLPSAKAVKTYVDAVAAAQNEASEIAVSPTVGDAPNNDTVQKVLETHESRLDTAETNITGLTNNKVTGPASATDNALVRFDLTTGKLVQNSVGILSDAGSLSGLTEIKIDDPAPLGIKLVVDKTGIYDNLRSQGIEFIEAGSLIDLTLSARNLSLNGTTVLPVKVDNTVVGSNATINPTTFSNVLLTNATLVSVSEIFAKTEGSLLILTNNTGNDVEILNNFSSINGIITGTEGDITFRNQSSLMLTYSEQLTRWILVGGTGGAASSVKFTNGAGEILSANDLVYQDKGTGLIYKAQANNDDKVDVLGFVRKSVASGETVEVNTSGVIKGFTALSVGRLYYLRDDLAGGISETPPAINGTWIVPVGMAVSETEIVINPVASSSAIYITDSEYVIGLPNDISTPDNITDLVFDPIQVRSFIVDYSIYREDSLVGKAQVGQLRGVYNSKNGVWLMADDFAGENAGVEFSVTPSGQVQYITSNFTGTGHDCTMKYTIRRTFTI